MKLLKDSMALDALQVDENALGVLNPDRLRILKALAEKPRYAADLAKTLRMHPQTAYYHLRILSKEGLIKLERFEQKHGGIAKQYVSTAKALALPLTEEFHPFAQNPKKPPAFLDAFIKDGTLNARLVVGSPEPHGAYRARGSEFAAIELSAFLSQYAQCPYPLYYLDTEALDRVRNENLFLVGGPKVNTLVHEANAHLPIRFTEAFDIHSTLTHKKYGDNVGVVQSADSPFTEGKKLFVIAGLSHNATRAAVLALSKHPKKLSTEPFAHVVQGFDEDGDGVVDAVEILE
ncbi:helix-turn-helix domain-containing protein [Candidatus Micrarchaeota archaeon]|nr:helix-turn-helix domain-containing protein [Candidatus Micrarchaeota archaeon]